MKALVHLTTVLVFTLFAAGCSKDKRIERTLHKKDGEWTITNVTWQKVVQDTSGQHISTGSTANAGKFSFDKDGSGSYSFTVDGTDYSQSFTWDVNDEKISVTKVSQSVNIFSGSVEQLAVAISGSRNSKTEIHLEGSETHQYVGGSPIISQHVFTGTFSLTR